MKRIVSGIFWTVVIYFFGYAILATMLASMSEANDPNGNTFAGAAVGLEVARQLRPWVACLAAVIGVVGVWFQFLPGSRLIQIPGLLGRKATP